jgi:phosphohistidine phosphatase
LLRHAQSADKQIGQTDQQRDLTPYGVKQSLKIASILLEQKTFPDKILCSTAQRTKTTLSFVAQVWKYDPEKIIYLEELYEASTRTLFQLISQLEDDLQHVMVVGHNPAISYLAEYLTKAEIGEMVPAGIAIIEFNTDFWNEVSAGSGHLIRYLNSEDV